MVFIGFTVRNKRNACVVWGPGRRTNAHGACRQLPRHPSAHGDDEQVLACVIKEAFSITFVFGACNDPRPIVLLWVNNWSDRLWEGWHLTQIGYLRPIRGPERCRHLSIFMLVGQWLGLTSVGEI